MNRTGKPINPDNVEIYQQLGLLTKQLTPAVLARVGGHVYVQPSGNPEDRSHLGKYWIKFQVGTDADGFASYSEPIAAMNHAFDIRPEKTNYPVLVYLSQADGGWVIAQANYRAANRAGFDTRQLNPNDPRQKHIALRQIRNGRLFSPATSEAIQTTVSVEGLLYLWEGQFKNAQKDQSIDLSGSIPTAGNERLVLLALRLHDNTIQIIDGSTRTLSTNKYALSDTDALVAQLDDYAHPLGAYQLGDAQTSVDDSDFAFDGRQFVNMPRPRGWPYVISRHIHLLAGQQETVRGSQTIEAGGILELDAGSDFLIEPETELPPAAAKNYTGVTAAYSILIDDGTIGADTSGGSFTVTLPSAIGLAGREYRVKKLSSGGTVTVATSSSQTIDGSSTAPLTTQWTAVVFISTGSNWIIG